MRLIRFPLFFLAYFHPFQPSPAWAAGSDGVGPDRFFSERKLLDAYSGFRHYLESDSGGGSQEGSGGYPDRFEIMARLIDTNRVSREMLYGIFRLGDAFAREIRRKVPDRLAEGICSRDEFRALHFSGAQEALLREIVKSQLFLDDPGEIEKARKDFDVSIIKKQSDAGGQAPPIPLEKLSLMGMPVATCLASMPDRGCLITVGEYNAYLPYADAQTGGNVAEAGEKLLRAYAFQKLKSLEGRREIDPAEKESIIQQVKDAQEYRRVRESLMGLGLPVMDEAALSAAYQKHYYRYFAQRDSASIQVLASTDSLLLDSIRNLLEPGPAKAPSAAHSKARSAGDSAFPWMAFGEADLPAEIAAPTDTFKVGQSSTVFRTSFGFFIAKLSGLVRIPRTPPEKARTMCIYLATWDKYLGMDSILLAKAKKHYNDHPDEFATPDTVAYDFWLAPRGKYRDARSYAADTSRFKSISKVDAGLPPGMTKKIRTRAIPDHLKLQMAETRFGQMLVRIKGIRKGGRKIPFAKARKGILEKIAARPDLPPVPSLAGVPEDSAISQEVLLTMGTGNRIFNSILEQESSLSKSEIDAAIAAGHIQPAAKDAETKDDQFYEHARRKMKFYDIGKKHESIQAELGKVVFHTGFFPAK